VSDSRETVAPFFAALRKDFPSTLALHAFAEAVFFVTAAHMGLKRTFRQRSFSSIFAGWPVLAAESAHRMPLADASELRSVFDRRSTVKEASLARHCPAFLLKPGIRVSRMIVSSGMHSLRSQQVAAQDLFTMSAIQAARKTAQIAPQVSEKSFR